MAIAYQTGGAQGEANSTTRTVSINTTGGTGIIIFATVQCRNATDLVTGVTWNTTENFTKLGSAMYLVGNVEFYSFLYLANATAGNFNVVATLSSSVVTSMHVASYTGAATTQVDIATNLVTQAQTTSTDLTITASSTVNNSWFIISGFTESSTGLQTLESDGGTTSTLRQRSTALQHGYVDSNASQPIGSYAMHILMGSAGSNPKLAGFMTAIEASDTSVIFIPQVIII